MTVMDTKEIQEAIQHFEKMHKDTTIHISQHTRVLLSLAESYLKVEGLPSKVNASNSSRDAMHHADGYNSAIDLCSLAISKLYVKRSEFPSEEELENIIRTTEWDMLSGGGARDVAHAISSRLDKKG